MQHSYFTNSTNVGGNNFQSYHANISYQRDVKKTMLFIGSSGSGKTAVIHYLCCLDKNNNIDSNVSKLSGESVTKDVKRYRSPVFINNNVQYSFDIFDTVGLGADDINSTAEYQKLFMNIMFEHEIDLIVIVVKIERFRNKFKEDIDNMVVALRNLGAADSNFCLLLTHIDPWNEKLCQDFSANFKQKHNLNFISEKNHTWYGCFANVTDVHSELQQKYNEWVNFSIGRTRDWLFSIVCQPFRPIVNVQKNSGIDYVKVSKNFLQKR